jgi:hypothetical protein
LLQMAAPGAGRIKKLDVFQIGHTLQLSME